MAIASVVFLSRYGPIECCVCLCFTYCIGLKIWLIKYYVTICHLTVKNDCLFHLLFILNSSSQMSPITCVQSIFFFFHGPTEVKENGQWDERGGVRGGGVDRGWGKRLSAGSSVSTYFNLEILEESNVARTTQKKNWKDSFISTYLSVT